jgi:hypothetical protein
MSFTPIFQTAPVIVSTTDTDTGVVLSFTEDPLYCLTQSSAEELASLFSAQGLTGSVAMGSPIGYPTVFGDYTSSAQVPWLQFKAGPKVTNWMNAGVQANFFNHGQPYLYAFSNCLMDILAKLG